MNTATKGALVGALIAIGMPVMLLAISIAGYKGGGANIGVGLVFFALPVYLPIAIWLGWIFGKKRSKKT